MKLQTLFCATLMGSLTLVAGQVRTTPARTAGAADIPHLRKQGTATQLIVDGQPFLALAGELSNSSSSSVEYTKPIWPMLAAQKSTRSWRPFTGLRSNHRKGSSTSAYRTASSGKPGATTCVSCFYGSPLGRTVCPATRPTG